MLNKCAHFKKNYSINHISISTYNNYINQTSITNQVQELLFKKARKL